MSYEFTNDWFGTAPPVWSVIRRRMKERKAFLEIGSFEGRSACWVVEHMLEDGGHIDCIDTWLGSEEHTDVDMVLVEDRFDSNTEEVMRKFSDETGVHREVCKYKMDATKFMAAKLHSPLAPMYDFIYIDGSHIAKDVLTDACMAFGLLKHGGIMVFDDYLWGDARDILHRPRLALNAFGDIFAEHIDIIHIGYQFIIEKKG